ncbi:MAG: ABC transporter permease subunit, partial [Bacteroidota bacterium]
SGWKNAAACILCFIPVFLGFLLPLMLLVILFIDHVEFVNARFLAYLANTITIAALASISCVMVAVLLAYSARLSNSAFVATLNRLGTLGYAIPGSVIAVGILIPFGWFDNTIDSWFRSVFGISTGLLLSGTVVALVFAYIVRFLAVAFGGIETSLQKVTTNMDEAARGMGYSFGNIARHIHLPMLKGSMLTAALLVFVDVMKELPATLIVRPFNFDTLAVQVYRLASDERLGESSGAALAIVLAGLIPVVLISRRMSDRR